MQEVELFPCYSFKLMKWLTEEKKFKYKLKGLNPKNKMMFWVFIDDNEFKKLINEWNEIKSKMI